MNVTTGRWFGVYFRGSSDTLTDLFFTFTLAASDQFTVQINTSRNIVLRRGGSAGTILATSAAALATLLTGVWMEVELLAASAGGSCAVYISGSGVAAVSFAGDTANLSSDGWDGFSFGQTPAAATTTYDDVIVTTNAEGRPNEVFIVSQSPNGNDAIQSTSSGGGAGTFANVDEVPFATADYNIFTSGQQDIYTTTLLPYIPTAVLAVKVRPFAEREGTIVAVQSILVSGAVTTTATAYVPAAAGVFASNDTIYNTDPNTGAAWTFAGVNAVLIGARFS
jgi:hypothetical protein